MWLSISLFFAILNPLLSASQSLNLNHFSTGDWNPIEQTGSRADSFEYVMHGKIYRIEGEDTLSDSSVRIAEYSISRSLKNNFCCSF